MILADSTNAAYHSNRSHLSSSLLKVLLQSSEEFYEQWFGAPTAGAERDVFSEGSFVHTLLLEPQKVASDYAMFEGLRKQGKAWEEFKEANIGKVILSAPQVKRCEELAKAATALPVAMSLLSGGLAEHTMTASILDVLVKARADYINVDKCYIVDVKTTSMPSDPDIFRLTVDQYYYQLSAALYCQIAYATYGKLFDFYFIVLSKHDKMCHVYKASSNTLSVGAALVTQSIVKYKHCLASGNWSNNQEKADFSTEQYEIQDI